MKKKILTVIVSLIIDGEHVHNPNTESTRQITGLERVEIAKKINETANDSAKTYRLKEIARNGTSKGVPSEATYRKILSEGEDIAYKGKDWLSCLITSINSKHKTIIGK